MKRTMQFVLAAGLALCLSAPALHASDAPADGMSDRMMEKMTANLGLTDGQAAKVKDAAATHRQAMKSIMEKLKSDRDKLRGLVDKQASDTDVSDAILQLKADRKEMSESQEKFQDTLQSILTPMQQAKAILSRGGARGHWGGRHAGKDKAKAVDGAEEGE